MMRGIEITAFLKLKRVENHNSAYVIKKELLTLAFLTYYSFFLRQKSSPREK